MLLRSLSKRGIDVDNLDAAIGAADLPNSPASSIDSASLETWDDKNKLLRRRIRRLVNVIHHKTEISHSDIHEAWISEGHSRQAAAGNNELEEKINWLQAWLRTLA